MAEFVCPICGADTRVVRTHKSPGAIRRDRQCKNLKDGPHDFETSEQPVSEGLLVERSRQRGGRPVIEPFDRKKIEASMRLAAAGSLSYEIIAAATDSVIAAVKPSRAFETIATSHIGEAVLEQLLNRSKTAGLRYATVFLSSRHVISTPSDLEAWISKRLPFGKAIC